VLSKFILDEEDNIIMEGTGGAALKAVIVSVCDQFTW